MSKAILVMDMPKSCLECPIGKDMSICIETCIKCPFGKCAIDEEAEKIPEWCPLQKFPKKIHTMIEVKEKIVYAGCDCWGKREYESIYVVVNEDGNEIFRSHDDPTELINILTK